MKDHRQLLCTFSNVDDFKTTIDEIRKFYNVSGKIFVFLNVNNPNELFVTYNVIKDENGFPKFKNTISVHRKKLTNTIFSLNAMNQVIRDENNGEFSESFEVNWNLYENSLLVTGEMGVRVVPLKIFDVVE